jgi:putative SOS response-associated peptidase YedK
LPIIIAPEHYGWWHNEDGKGEFLKRLLGPYPVEDMKRYRVSPLVKNPQNGVPECLRPG